ncbi:glycoside hydrolase family 44 protein [Uliginosibacterium gangwonense]|uniref:glycoside hydrolase family 44 protein n=1 Tax=Uliginosibacterium gangwonense TaxID=392736 RepID=UPI0003AADB2A|nr:glycoside hydrolase family 44 protein [Uliginosibacterium gangwonense]
MIKSKRLGSRLPKGPLFVLALLPMTISLAFADTGPALSVDATANVKVINPLIYGMNFTDEALAKELSLPIRRRGGNQTSRYNWKSDISNRGSDWYFENIPEEILGGNAIDISKLPEGSSANLFIEQDRRTGTKTLLTIPMSGWVAKGRTANSSHPFDCGFKISRYGAQQSSDTWDSDCGNGIKADGSKITGNDPLDTSMAIDPTFVQDWLRYLIGKYDTPDNGGVKFLNLDNEPELWSSTHHDVRPQHLGYDELMSRTISYASAIKSVDKGFMTLGPASWGWVPYFYSDLDSSQNSQADRAAHGNVPLTDWYLQQLKAYETKNGVRLLDYLDEHYYPQASNVVSSTNDAATNALRLRQTRVLWDPNYTDESWIAQPVRLIPRMRDWVNTNYPGTKIAMSEYNFGALAYLNGALTQADVLGIFGREGLDLATLWDPPKATDPGAFAFRMYRNYDGAGSRFADVSVSASSTDQGKLAVYAAKSTVGNLLTLMLVNKTDVDLTSAISLANFSPASAAKVYRYSGEDLTAIKHLADQTVSSSGFTATYPANSITMVAISAKSDSSSGSSPGSGGGTTGACTISYTVSNQWDSGFTANVEVKNTGATAINGWAVTWQFVGNQQITNLWNATLSTGGNGVTASNANWNGNIVAGASISFGFQASYSGTNAIPASFTLNGMTCK